MIGKTPDWISRLMVGPMAGMGNIGGSEEEVASSILVRLRHKCLGNNQL